MDEYYVIYVTLDKKVVKDYRGGYMGKEMAEHYLKAVLSRDDVFHAWIEFDYIQP